MKESNANAFYPYFQSSDTKNIIVDIGKFLPIKLTFQLADHNMELINRCDIADDKLSSPDHGPASILLDLASLGDGSCTRPGTRRRAKLKLR